MRRILNVVVILITYHLSLITSFAQTAQQWRDSLAVLNRMIELQPKSTDLRLRKAAVNIELNQWEYAVEEYGRVFCLNWRIPSRRKLKWKRRLSVRSAMRSWIRFATR